MVRIVLILLLEAVHLVVGIPQFLSAADTQWWVKALSYPFFHANVFHLAVNCIAVWAIYRPGVCKPCRDLLFPFVVSFLVYPISPRPVIGISNMLYAAIGARTPSLSSPWWRRTPTIIFLSITVLMLFIPQFSAVTHILSFVAGALLASFHRFYLNITKDARRYY